MTFDLDDIDGLIDYLDDYSKSLDEKALHISERLAELGISVAQRESGSGMGKYLIFGKEVANGTVLFYGTQTGVITSTWKTRDGWVSADIHRISVDREHSQGRLMLSTQRVGIGLMITDGIIPMV